MGFKNLPEHLQDASRIFEGSRIDLYRKDAIDENGRTHIREIVVHPGAVVILPFLNPQKIVLIRNFRVAIGKTLLELPAGTLEPNELPIDTARRELIEETGYQCGSMEPLMQFYTTPGFCTEHMHAFLAKDLHLVGQHLDEGEEIEVETVSLDEAYQLIKKGSIEDGKTIATILYYATFIQTSRLSFVD